MPGTGIQQSGTLPSASAQPIQVAHLRTPMTVTLKSAAGGRLIEISTDGGTEYFSPTVDTTSATMLVVAIMAPVSHIRLTGATSDAWSIR